MKKAFFIFMLGSVICFIFTGCSPSGYCNILLFNDRLSEISGERLSVEDYTLKDGIFRLIAENEGTRLLITCEENESLQIKKVGVTISKLDENAAEKAPDSNALAFYRQKVAESIYAFTLFDEEKSREIAEKILPLKSEELLREGELTMEAENFHFVYYSNKLCCRFTVTDTYLEKTEETQKPVSKPLNP